MTEILGHIAAPLPLLLVVAGAGLIALAQQGFAALPAALGALKPLFTAKPDDDRDSARGLLLRIEDVVQSHGLARADRLRAAHPFTTEAVTRLANTTDADHFAIWADQTLADRQDRHLRAIGFWNAVADAAPAMGMAGTILGLIGMFARMNDPATIGPAMALALMTTMHGMLLANAVAAPIANRLAQLSQRELNWQREAADRMIAVAKREAAPALKSGVREAA